MKRLVALFLAVSACAPDAPKVVAIVDTLPGGVIRVQNPAPSGWTDTDHITFTEIVRIQPGEGEPGDLGDISDMVVDDAGNIIIAQNGPVRVDRFAPDGRYLGTLGRQGGGPGEYQTAFLAWTGGHLFVHDPEQSRTSVFDSSGAFIRGWPSTCCFWRWIGSDTLGRAYVPVMPQGPMDSLGPGWVRFDPAGTAVDTVWRRPNPAGIKYWEHKTANGSSRWTIPNQPSIVDVPWRGGGLLVGDNATYSITISRNGRDSALVFGRTWTPQEVPEAVRRARFDQMISRNERLKSIARFEDIPATAPAFGALEVDAEGRIWVGVSVPSDTVRSHWDIFTSEGIWLGSTTAPFRGGRMASRHGDVIISTTDQDDLPVIIRYRIVENGSGGTSATANLGS